jgi:prepilin-type N-terminal cleavage/methylation domain-containing protein
MRSMGLNATTPGERGFTLTELLVSTTIVLLVLGTAMTTYKNALSVNQAVTQTADANQNLREGTNLLIRDLMQTARGIPTGGIPIPSGAGSRPINRPHPPSGGALFFDNVNSTTLPAIITGGSLGPTIDGETTDIITILMTDTILGQLATNTGLAGQATVAADGSSINVGGSTAWLAGNLGQGVNPVNTGDLMWISNARGSTLQTVTSTTATTMSFAPGQDWFNFNQPGAAQGSVTQIVAGGVTQGTVTRILMTTYYVDNVTNPGTPRLTRVQSAGTPQALAGVIEDLNLTYDLVDGVVNPTLVANLPYTLNGNTYSPNQVRKVNLHVGVRSDVLSPQQNDYIRSHVSTVVSIRSLAFVNRYP